MKLGVGALAIPAIWLLLSKPMKSPRSSNGVFAKFEVESVKSAKSARSSCTEIEARTIEGLSAGPSGRFDDGLVDAESTFCSTLIQGARVAGVGWGMPPSPRSKSPKRSRFRTCLVFEAGRGFVDGPGALCGVLLYGVEGRDTWSRASSKFSWPEERCKKVSRETGIADRKSRSSVDSSTSLDPSTGTIVLRRDILPNKRDIVDAGACPPNAMPGALGS